MSKEAAIKTLGCGMLKVESEADEASIPPRKGQADSGALCSMTIQEMIKKAGDTMTLAAQAFADRGQKSYTTEMHAACAGKAIAGVQAAKVKELTDSAQSDTDMLLTAAELAAMFHALYNQSAWRQKFEKAGVFAAATKRATTFEEYAAQLDEEGV
jgi:hypothetical protein